MPNKEYRVDFSWDEDAGVWIATSDEIQGLVLESGSADALMERVRHVAPEIMKLNSQDYENCRLHFHINRYATVCV